MSAQSHEWTRALVSREHIGSIGYLFESAYISDFSLFIDLLLQALKDLRLQQSLGVSRHFDCAVWYLLEDGLLLRWANVVESKSFDYIITVIIHAAKITNRISMQGHLGLFACVNMNLSDAQ